MSEHTLKGPMYTPFFYPVESAEAIAYHKSQSMNGQLTKIEEYRSNRKIPRDRRMVDHRADDLCQWRVYDQMIKAHFTSK
jgi:hypothetical protein